MQDSPEHQRALDGVLEGLTDALHAQQIQEIETTQGSFEKL